MESPSISGIQFNWQGGSRRTYDPKPSAQTKSAPLATTHAHALLHLSLHGSDYVSPISPSLPEAAWVSQMPHPYSDPKLYGLQMRGVMSVLQSRKQQSAWLGLILDNLALYFGWLYWSIFSIQRAERWIVGMWILWVLLLVGLSYCSGDGFRFILDSTRQPMVQMALKRMLLRERTEVNVSYFGSKTGTYRSCGRDFIRQLWP